MAIGHSSLTLIIAAVIAAPCVAAWLVMTKARVVRCGAGRQGKCDEPRYAVFMFVPSVSEGEDVEM